MHLPQVVVEILRSIWYQEEQPCAVCGGQNGPVCPACLREYFHPELNRCHNCGKLISPEKDKCDDCLYGKGPGFLQRTVAWGHYAGLWKEFIWKVKFNAQPLRLGKIAEPFANWSIKRLPAPDGVVPVPLHTERLGERGFNQAEVIASLLHWQLGLPLLDVLRRKKITPTQVGLTRRERLKNLGDAFEIRECNKVKNRTLWLVDDVTTTGATLEACAGVLLQAGAERVYGLCLAAGRETEGRIQNTGDRSQNERSEKDSQ